MQEREKLAKEMEERSFIRSMWFQGPKTLRCGALLGVSKAFRAYLRWFWTFQLLSSKGSRHEAQLQQRDVEIGSLKEQTQPHGESFSHSFRYVFEVFSSQKDLEGPSQYKTIKRKQVQRHL